MLVLEAKIKGKVQQFEALDEAIRTFRFIQNSCLRYWMDNAKVSRNDLYKHCKVLADNTEFPWASKVNSQARQAAAERAWSAIARFYDNCKINKPGKKGFPKFKKHSTRASVEYKVTGWKLSNDRKSITFKDKVGAGRFQLKGTRDLSFYQSDQINRVRVVRRSDGYYVQFVLDVERTADREPTRKTIGLDVGLNHFYTDSDGNTVENPRHLRKAEKRLKRLQRQASQKQKGSSNRRKAVKRLGKAHLKVQRQRRDFAAKTARCVVKSNDFVAFEDLQIRNLVKNRHLAKSISDAAWGEFRRWVEYFGKVFGVATVAVAPQYTSQICSNCGETVKKTLSARTHVCGPCGHVQDRDHNAAINILKKGLNTVGHTEIQAWGENDLYLSQATGLDKLAR
ncbi:MAG: transposase [Trichocoleus desertorum ATA4-8-CV12]|jgi:putative transposase|nr:transposase [Trichocoleus desertorum ATA4-8-CV12]